MAEDISPQIHEQLISSINQNNARNRKENRIAVDAENGKVDMRSASEYAGLRGKDVADALLEISGSDLPNGRMYYNIAEKAVRPVLNDMTEQVLDVADQAVTVTNKAAGIGLKPVRPDETEKVKGILDLASSKDWDDVKNEVASSTENLARKCVDDSVRENADFQYQAGLDPKIVRTASRGACEWCREVAGTYDYADVSDRGNDVFRRHADCSCLVEYEPVKGRRKTVSSNSYRQNRDSMTPEEREIIAEAGGISRNKNDEIIAQADTNRIPHKIERSRVINEAIAAKEPVYADDLRNAYKYIIPREGYVDVCLHGEQYYTYYEHIYKLDNETLAYIISGRRDCAGQNIRLISCYTGIADNHGNCVAQELADRLKVEIRAPIGIAQIREDGSITVRVNRRILSEEDGFITFSPRS